MTQILRYVLESAGQAAVVEKHTDGDEVDLDAISSEMQQLMDLGWTATVSMPGDARLLPSVGLTSKGIVIYALADPDAPETVERDFFVIGNGRDLPEAISDPEQAQLAFLATVKPIPGSPTFHVFELVKAAV